MFGIGLVEARAMPEETNGFHLLMERIREGSEDAVCELIEEYGPHIFRAVRRNLTQPMRMKFDSADFVQDVWASMFATKEFGCNIETPEDLVNYLGVMARNKVVEANRKGYGTQKRDLSRENSLDGSAAVQIKALAGSQPSPSQIMMATEEYERLSEGLTPTQRAILSALRGGNSPAETARAVGVALNTVQRFVEKIKPEVPSHDDSTPREFAPNRSKD